MGRELPCEQKIEKKILVSNEKKPHYIKCFGDVGIVEEIDAFKVFYLLYIFSYIGIFDFLLNLSWVSNERHTSLIPDTKFFLYYPIII